MQKNNIPAVYWIAIGLFTISSVMDLVTGRYMEMISAACALLAFILLAVNLRLQLASVRWGAYLLLAVALTVRILLLINKYGYNNQLF